MMDNSQDKGYITVYIKQVGDTWHLCEMSWSQSEGEEPFYVDYENGTIFIVSGDDKSIIGTYETTPTRRMVQKCSTIPQSVSSVGSGKS